MKVLVLLAAILAMKDLPPAVRATVERETKGAEVKTISKESENGKTTYEVETLVNGKHRDLEIDSRGAVVEIEEETAVSGIPAAAKAVIGKKAAGGRVTVVETVTSGGAIVAYEAEYIDKNGHKREVRVKPDGTVVPD
ncbi:MAG TPA: PepSY domain-containing protein [Bryobacteraceae bacterium]|nr:PepSY domain-containing protein [Bryobacteraceae bacterium]